ncbi:hypothetical protein Cma02nite_14260 [Cellulomonas marina]|nr:hypothetical protein Cma02nite_14260 [Cellulomonas marina]
MDGVYHPDGDRHQHLVPPGPVAEHAPLREGWTDADRGAVTDGPRARDGQTAPTRTSGRRGRWHVLVPAGGNGSDVPPVRKDN